MAEQTPDPVEEESTEADTTLEDDGTTFDETEEETDEAAESEETEEAEPEVDTTEDEPDTEETTEEVPEVKEADDTKQRNREMAEKRIAERQAREEALKQQQQEYVAEADAEDPRDLAVRQLQVDAYNNKVEANTNKLTNGYEKALKDFSILNNPSPEIQAELSEAIDSFQARYVKVDSFGNPTEVSGDMYAYLQAKADSIERLTGIRSKTQEQAKTKEQSKVLATPTRAPKTPKVDPDIAGFDEEAKRW